MAGVVHWCVRVTVAVHGVDGDAGIVQDTAGGAHVHVAGTSQPSIVTRGTRFGTGEKVPPVTVVVVAAVALPVKRRDAWGDVVTVEFVLVAGTPWAWTDPVPLLDVALPQPDLTDCVTWCLSAAVIGPNFCPPGSCQFESCDAGQDPCGDPLNMIPAPPQPTAPATAFCMPLAPERACYTIDLTDRPTWSSDVPTITIAAGTRDLRNVRVTFYEKRSADDDCDATADAQRCNPVNDFVISYVPALNNVTIDGQISRAVMACGDRCTTSSTVYGNPDGAPVSVAPLSCALYCVCIEVDSLFPPAEDAQLSLSVSGRGL